MFGLKLLNITGLFYRKNIFHYIEKNLFFLIPMF